jgi:hypothetical protein
MVLSVASSVQCSQSSGHPKVSNIYFNWKPQLFCRAYSCRYRTERLLLCILMINCLCVDTNNLFFILIFNFVRLFWGAVALRVSRPLFILTKRRTPVTVAERSKACTVFARSEAGIWVRIPHKAWMFGVCVCVCVCMRLFRVYSVLCLGRGLATSWSPVKGVLPSIKWTRNWEIRTMLQSGNKMSKKRGVHGRGTDDRIARFLDFVHCPLF